MKGEEIKTEKGIGTCLGVLNDYAVMLYFSPAPKTPDPEFTGDVNIHFSPQNDLQNSVGNLSLSEMVECAINDCGIVVSSELPLSKDDCSMLDRMVCTTLKNKYQMALPRLMLTEPR